MEGSERTEHTWERGLCGGPDRLCKRVSGYKRNTQGPEICKQTGA